MNLKNTLEAISVALNDSKIKFALIGGFALAAHGVMRATQDIDLLIDGNKKQEAESAAKKAGFAVVFKSDEVLQLSGPGQVDFLFANREKTQSMILRSKTLTDLNVNVVSAEDLIGLKIQAYSNDKTREFQDKADIQALLKANTRLDLKTIKDYADMFGEWHTIEKLKSLV